MKSFFITLASFFLLVSCGGGGTPPTSDADENVDFGSLNDTIAHFKTLDYHPNTISLYQYVSSYLYSAKEHGDIEPSEYDIQITSARNMMGKKVHKAIDEIINPGTQCQGQHKKLNELQHWMSDLMKYEGLNKELKSELQLDRQHLEIHNKLIQLVYSTQSYGPEPSAVNEVYNTSYPSNVLAQSFELKNKYPYQCNSVQQAIPSIKSKLNERHRRFLTALVGLYVNQSTYDYNIDTKVTSEIDKYYYKGGQDEWAVKYGVSPNVARFFTDNLVQQMRDFKQNNKNY